MRFYHGTAVDDARNLVEGAVLSAVDAAHAKLDGPPGFYLADVQSDAEFFALRRVTGAIIVVDIDEEAVKVLIARGAEQRPIPVSPRSPRFRGTELRVPVELFELFNSLRARGSINVHS